MILKNKATRLLNFDIPQKYIPRKFVQLRTVLLLGGLFRPTHSKWYHVEHDLQTIEFE